jgi:protease-4
MTRLLPIVVLAGCCLAALAGRCVSAKEPAAAVSGSETKEVATEGKQVKLAVLTLKEDYAEGTAAPGLFGELKPHLREVLTRLDKIAKDDKIQGVVLRLRSPGMGLGKVDEMRGAIARTRHAGKKVYAEIESVTTKDYLIASACDAIVVPPSGELIITGLRAEVTFYKGLFDKLGVQADFIQMGDYKGASEPFTRTDMSPEFRKQFESVIEDYYAMLVERIAADRKLEPAKVKELIDEGLLSAARAKETGLVDYVAYEDEFRDQLKTALKAEDVALVRDYGKKKVDADMSGLAGMMKLMELMTGAESTPKVSRGDKIALIYAVGTIVESEGSASPLMDAEGITSDSMIKALREAESDAKVKAIVLRIDSPGGSALASDLIWREITKAKKPIVASMGDTAASGGYYIAMGCDKIYAEPGTLTGSIGVVGGKMAIKGLLGKVGVTTDTIQRGKNSGVFSIVDGFTDSERDAWKRLMGEIYKQFTTKAAEGRHMDVADLEKLAGGRLFSGRMALANHLVDKLGTLEEAVAEAKTLAGMKAEDKAELLILPKPKNFIEQLLEGPQLETEIGVPALGFSSANLLPAELQSLVRSAATWQQLFRRPAATVLPFQVEIK